MHFSVSLDLSRVGKVDNLLFETESVELVESSSDDLTDLVGGLRLVSSVNLDHIFNSNNSGETVEEADSGSFGRVILGDET